MLGICALAVSLVGCSKEDKYKSLLREARKIETKFLIEEKLKMLNSLSPEEQATWMERLKKEIKRLREENKARGDRRLSSAHC